MVLSPALTLQNLQSHRDIKVEASKLEYQYPHSDKANYRKLQHESSSSHVPTLKVSLCNYAWES